MEIKILAKNTLFLAGPKVIKFFVGIVKSKLIAIFLGVVGVGIINQLQTTITQIKTFTLSSMPQGMVKLIAEENSVSHSVETVASIIRTYLLIIIPITILVTALGFFFAEDITVFVFGDISYILYFKIGYISLPFAVLASSAVSLLQGFKKIKSIATSGVIIIILNFITFIPLIYFWGLIGGVIQVSLSFLTTFFVFFYFVKRDIINDHNVSVELITKAVFSKIFFKEIMSFMGFGLIAGTYYIFTEITARSIVVNELGIDKLGIYTPITAWASLFVGFILPSLNTYLFPRISESKSDEDIVSVVNDVIRLTTFMTIPFVLIGISTRNWIIPLFYSKDFVEASLYLPYHFSALIFTIWTFAFTYIFAPTGRLRSFLFFAIVVHSLSLGLVYYLVPDFGLFGYLSKFTVTPIISLIIYFSFWSREINFRLQRDNIRIMFYAIICVALMLLFKDSKVYLQIVAFILLVVEAFLLNKKERKYILRKFKRN